MHGQGLWVKCKRKRLALWSAWTSLAEGPVSALYTSVKDYQQLCLQWAHWGLLKRACLGSNSLNTRSSLGYKHLTYVQLVQRNEHMRDWQDKIAGCCWATGIFCCVIFLLCKLLLRLCNFWMTECPWINYNLPLAYILLMATFPTCKLAQVTNSSQEKNPTVTWGRPTLDVHLDGLWRWTELKGNNNL